MANLLHIVGLTLRQRSRAFRCAIFFDAVKPHVRVRKNATSHYCFAWPEYDNEAGGLTESAVVNLTKQGAAAPKRAL